MNKLVSIRIQRFMSYIPLVNATVLFVWIYNCRVANIEQKVFARSLYVLLRATLPIAILQMVLVNAFATHTTVVLIFNYLAIYTIPFSMARALIWFQEKI